MTTVPWAFWCVPQAPMTKASLTERQAMVSMPFFLRAASFWTNPGTCLAEQVGVKAPGTAKSTTFLPLKNSSVVTSLTPSGVISLNFADGTLSPTLMVMAFPFLVVGCELCREMLGWRRHPFLPYRQAG